MGIVAVGVIALGLDLSGIREVESSADLDEWLNP
jgi:hypothetical protein